MSSKTSLAVKVNTLGGRYCSYPVKSTGGYDIKDKIRGKVRHGHFFAWSIQNISYISNIQVFCTCTTQLYFETAIVVSISVAKLINGVNE